MIKPFTPALLAFCLFTAVVSVWASAAETRHNLDASGIAIKGYDPVSYHLGKPAKGKNEIFMSHKNVTYLFVNDDNRQTFKKDPAQYLPAFGGWCAWAMLEGQKVKIDPKRYKIVAGRTFLFYNTFFTDTLKKWNQRAQKETEAALVKQADNHWQLLTGQ